MAFVVALLATGAVAGILGALMGLGGGIFLVPALTLLFHLPIHTAVGTSLMGVIATSAGVAAIAPRGRSADISLALRLEVATAAGALGGGLLAQAVNARALDILFALVVFFAAGYLLYKARGRTQRGVPERLFYENYRLHHWPIGLLASSFAGMVSGLLGVGGGFIKVPVMHAVMGAPLGTATATSNFMVGITAAASIFIYYGRGDVYPLVVIPTSLGVFGGAMLGVYILPHLRVNWIRLALIGLLVFMGAQMLVQGLHS
jgi:uncharacterized membrane protein YfcA